MKTIREQICEIAAGTLDVPADKLRPDTPWEHYGGDSLAIVELVLAVQDHFKIHLDTAELGDLKCLDDLVALVERALDGEDPGPGVRRRRP